MIQFDETKWFIKKRRSKKENIAARMFLFPYAGGDVSSYFLWEKGFLNCIEICFLKLPGRGRRLEEPLENDLYKMAGEIADEINQMSPLPYCIFGHSMGALLAYETVLKCTESSIWLPRKVIVSSMKAPFILAKQNKDGKERKIHELSDKELEKEIIRIGGMDKLFLENSTFMKIILPQIKNDLQICETYTNECLRTIPIDLDIYCGKKDYLSTIEQMKPWKQYTTKNAYFQYFEGGHFYFKEQLENFLGLLSKTIEQIINES